MAEEIRNADVVVPWCMVGTTILNGAVGLGMVIAILFVTTDIDSSLMSPSGALGYPYMNIFYKAVGSKGGASALIAILIFMTEAGAVAALATGSRLLWAFARDQGLPFWRHISKVSSSPEASGDGSSEWHEINCTHELITSRFTPRAPSLSSLSLLLRSSAWSWV